MDEFVEIFMAKGMSKKDAISEFKTLKREYDEIVAEVADPTEAYDELVSLFRRFGLSANYIDEMAMC